MATLVTRLKQQLAAAGVPVIDVSIGSSADKTTWKVEPALLQASAHAVIDAYTNPTPAQLTDEAAARDIDVKALKALLLEIYPYLGADKPTLAQLRKNIIERYKALS